MPEEPVGAAPDSPPADAPAASSAELDGIASPASEPTPPPPSQPERKPWNMPPEERWQEVLRERDEARRAYQELAARAVQPQTPVMPQTPQADPWEGLVNHPDPATAQFYQQQKRLVDHAVHQGRSQAFQELQPVLTSLQQGQASIQIREFRKENPDIKPGSEEERQVVAYMQGQMDGVRHPLESARRNVLFDRLDTENRALKSKQASVGLKQAASRIEASAGVPQVSGLPQTPSSWHDQVRETVRKGGGMLEAAKAAFGVKPKPAE